MMNGLTGKVALITGGCSGIGEATAQLFLGQGAHVVVVDRQAPVGALTQAGAERLHHVSADVTQVADLERAFASAADKFGGLDILVNNAGAGGPLAKIVDMDPDQWDMMFALTVRAPMLGIKLGAPMMKARGGGSIINVASIAGLRTGLTAGAAYSVAKAAVLKLTGSAALELAGDNIRVNTLLPGAVATPIFGGGFGLSPEVARAHLGEVEEIYRHAQPLPVTGTPARLADAILFLASDQSGFITGLDMIVDGGLTLNPAVWGDARQRMIDLGQRLKAQHG
ncbi:MAG: SDR family NAD(P)-dependent oxidoreductase [Sphingobium sp.]